MIETQHLKNVVIFLQTILSFVLSRKITELLCRPILNLVNQNKQHKRKHTAILQVMIT